MIVKKSKLFDIHTAKVDDSILKVSKKLKKEKQRHLVILKGNEPVGVVAAVDIVNEVVAKTKDPEKVKAKDIMNSPVYTVKADDNIIQAYFFMMNHNIVSCPVVDDKKILGVITLQEALKHIKEMKKEEEKKKGK